MTDSGSRQSKLARIVAMIRHEGIAGIVGRIRYRRRLRLADLPPVPELDAGLVLIDHGHPLLASCMSKGFTAIGVRMLSADSPQAPDVPRLHIGWPADPSMLRPGDLLCPPPEGGAPEPDGLRRGLRLEHRAAHIDGTAQRTGLPFVISLPALPDASASPDEWDRYPKKNLFSFQRIAAFCRFAGDVDYRPQLIEAAAHGLPVMLCLSLPETPARRQRFLQRRLSGFTVIDGICDVEGWRGAGASYKALALAALDLGLSELVIVQDDMLPRDNFQHRLSLALDEFHRRGADLFSGLVTEAGPEMVTGEVSEFSDAAGRLRFFGLRRNVGLVLTILGPKAMRHLVNWVDSSDTGHTIDRHLSRAKDLHVMACLPYLAGHDPSLDSAAWFFPNARYETLIRASEKLLAKQVDGQK